MFSYETYSCPKLLYPGWQAVRLSLVLKVIFVAARSAMGAKQ